MKRLYTLIICIILLYSIGNAQIPYHPFPVKNAQWAEVEGSDNLGDFNFWGKLFTLANDTIINGKSYVEVGYNNTWYATSPFAKDIHNYKYLLPGYVFAAIREDSSKKVWIRLIDSSALDVFQYYYHPINLSLDSDFILYDFSLKEGDTIKWMFQMGGYQNIVTKIDSVRLSNGEWRQQMIIEPSGGFFGITDQWIEGIGSVRGLLGPYEGPNPEGGSYDLICFSNDIVACSFPSNNLYLQIECTWVYNGIDEINENPLFIYPNPANDKISFNSSENISGCKIEITDLLGRTIIKEVTSNNSIDVSALSNGIYILRIRNKNAEVLFCDKLVKE